MAETLGLMHNNIKSWSLGLFGSMSFAHTSLEIQSRNDKNVGPLMACCCYHFLQTIKKTTISNQTQCDERYKLVKNFITYKKRHLTNVCNLTLAMEP